MCAAETHGIVELVWLMELVLKKWVRPASVLLGELVQQDSIAFTGL